MQTLRTRFVTNSPAEEYAARPGQVVTLSNDIAALLMHATRKETPTLNGITVTIDGIRSTYWHPESIVCSEIGIARMPQIVAAWNRLDPTLIHVLSLSGKYIETLPLKATADVLGRSEDDSQAIAASRRAINRATDHLRKVHRPDIEEAVQRNLENAAAINRAVTTLPASLPEPSRESQPYQTPVSNRATQAANRIESDRAITMQSRRTAEEAEEHLSARGITPAATRHRHVTPVTTIAFDPFDLD